jgi:hypothetical protein
MFNVNSIWNKHLSRKIAGQSGWNPARDEITWVFHMGRNKGPLQLQLFCHLPDKWTLLVVHAHGVNGLETP